MALKKLIACTLFMGAMISSCSCASPSSYTFVVAQDGSGNFRTIQQAIDSCRAYPEWRYHIFIKNGVYREKVDIPSWKTNITLEGEDVDRTIIVYDDYTGKTDGRGRVIGTFTSFTCRIAGNNCIVENITFINAAGRVGQGVAIHAEGDRCVFRRCKFLGNQDTVFASGEDSRQYYADCFIEGTTDFIFGGATAVFERCTIKSKTNSFITAASTLPARPYGFVFLHCTLVADNEVTQVYLGRPWRSHAYTAFINCTLGGHIRPEGWHPWDKPNPEKTVRYMEYHNTGPGATVSGRVAWSRQLTAGEAATLTVHNVLSGCDHWDPLQP